ncbi:hypothetical protein M9Y10_039438 [Tritrichomonas musculus]|uniref:Uncharacterized protein n=1 Tax=Tritrichomonas musculus TaxID=1915356 RepID=A0ABR2KBA6_9EUKA
MNTDETSPFKKLREIAIAINSVDSAKERLVDVISLMSEINNLYISITYEKFSMMKKLEEIADNARKQQIIVEESLHSRQLLADQNLASIPDTSGISEKEISRIGVPPITQFQEENGLKDEEIEELDKNGVLLYRRLEHEIQKIPSIKEEYNNANTTRFELKKNLDDARKKYSLLISKIQKMYDEIMGVLKNVDT